MGTLLGCIERKQGFRAPQLLLVVCNRNPYNFSSERKTLLLKKEKKNGKAQHNRGLIIRREET